MATTKTPARKTEAARPADWSLAPRGPVSGTAQGALAVAALAVAGDLAAVSPVWGCVATGAGAVATVLRSAYMEHPPAGLFYRLGCALGAGTWLTYTLAAGLWSQAAWVALGIGAASAGILSPLGRARARTRRTGTGRALVLSRTARVGDDWERRIQRVCRMRVTVTGVREWPTGAGYDLHLDLPGAGATRAQIAQGADALAVDARLPQGCGVEVMPGAHRGAVVLRVSTVNRLAEVIGYPEDYSPRSILEPIILGEHGNADPAGAVVREEAMLIAGKRGSGKTTLLQDASIALGRCANNLVWHLDLNGGGLTQPWIDVWLDGRVQRCPIDWAAPNAREGKLMLAAAIEIAKHRKASYRKLKRAHNTNLLPVSPDLPQITVMVDEGAQAVKDRELESLLGELQNIGRNEAVNLIVSALRPTSDLVPTNIRKQTGVRIQMFGPDEEELNHMFGWNAKISMDQLAGKGTGFISVDGGAPRPFRAFNVLPAQIEEAAISIATTRPDLDAASAEAAGPAYASRYDRMAAAFADLDGQDDGEHQESLPATYTAPAPVSPARPRLAAVSCGADASQWPDLRDLTKPATPAEPVLTSAADWPELLPRQRQALHAEQIHAVPAAPSRPLPEILARAIEAIEAADDDRMHSATLADALGTTPTDLAAALRPYGVTTLPNPFERGGTRGRGYALADLQTAAERIRRGGHDTPATAVS